MAHFLRLCLQVAFGPPLWEKANLIAAAIFCLIGLITHFAPRLLPSAPKIDDWVIIISVFLVMIVFRLLAAPYLVYKLVAGQRDTLRNALIKLRRYQEIERLK